MEIVFVNLYYVENPDKSWVLIDAGLYGSADRIRKAAEDKFGKGNPPKAILLTHGHFDHVGALQTLADIWQVPVYAHPLELPYLTGLSSYPPPDSSVGGGGMAYLSFMYPKKPIYFKGRLETLPTDGSVPFLPEWKWMETPGHSPGHVSYFREHDRVLLVGDAFVTRKPESALAVLTQKQEVCGPPAYFTPDWDSARSSVRKLADLNPAVAASGHGLPMRGLELRQGLDELARLFDQLAIPNKGRYVPEPAITDESGVVQLPPTVNNTVPKVLATAGLVALAGLATYALTKQKKRSGTNSKIKRTWPGYARRPSHFTPPEEHDPASTTNNPDISITNNYP
ncbi:MBL fold metallo-hydrolase [Rufibacter tibetensis]|uniref:MBL fold metallo-hydrolase n=2 Tax=Rufibacter tibetensis TaxID=512763 RepID=A0A0P0D353_9BACT|nr:MBL fold metallo-hydrolase [Rufibacter tibetensis]